MYQQDSFKIFVSIRKDIQSDIEYKKLILMVQAQSTISRLKRDIEKEFSDLFPFEEAFFCSKLEDEYGYALSNSSRVGDLLKPGDRVVAMPINKKHGGRDALSNASSLDENFSMVVSMIRNITVKFANTDLQNYDAIVQIIEFYIPIGFVDQKDFMLPTSSIIKAFAMSENFHVFSDPTRKSILRNLVTLLVFWLNHSMMTDAFFATNVIEAMQFFIKSSKFSTTLKKARVTHSLINLSKNPRVSASIKSRIVRIIKYLSLEDFLDSWKNKNTIQYKDVGRLDDVLRSEEPVHLLTGQERLEVLNKKINDNPDYFGDKRNGNSRPNSRRGQQLKVHHSTPQQEDSFGNRPEYVPSFGGQGEYSTSGIIKPPKSSSGRHSRRGKQLRMPSSEKQVRFGGPATQELDAFGEPTTMKHHQYNGGVFGDNTEMDGHFSNENLYLEYLSLLDPSNTQELISYGVQNLTPIIEDSIYSIMNSKPSYYKLLNLIELNLTTEDKVRQRKILNCCARNLTEDRAKDGINAQVIERILKFYNRQGPEFHDVFTALIFAHIKQSNYQIKVNGLIEMLKSPFINLQDLALKVLKEISNPTLQIPGSEFGRSTNNQSFNIQFENHLRYLLEQSLSKERSINQINSLIEILSNLSLNNYLTPELLHHRGIETFLYHLREKGNVEGQRLSAKGLLNLGAKNRENKLRIISELSYEIKAMHRGELDSVVRGYISALVQAKQ